MVRFESITAVPITDQVTGHTISAVYAIDQTGRVWRKISLQPWQLITTEEHFSKHEHDIGEK